MDTVIEWLNKDVILSEKIENIPEQFANGYYFGELLYKYNQLLEFPEGFKNQKYKNAMVGNFSKIEACLRNLGVRFTVSIAEEIIQKNTDTTFLLLRALKNTLEKTQGIVDVNVLKKTGAKNIIFPVNKYNFSKDRFATIQNQIFHKRLSNMLKPQNEVALDDKLEKFAEFEINEADRVRDLKQKEKEEHESELAYNREQLINQLKRTMNFGKQWESECKAQWEQNITIGKERLKEKENFTLKLKNKQTQVQLKVRKEYEETVKNDLNNFEEKHLQKKSKPVFDGPMNTLEEKLGNRERNLNSLANFLYQLVSHTPAIKIKERIKMRENVLNSELSKKERDRRLRKMLVDVRKYQSFKDLTNKKRLLLDTVMINSAQETKLYEEFDKIASYRDVFVENKKLRDNFYNRKKEEILQRNIDIKNRELEQQQIENVRLLNDFNHQISELDKKTELLSYKSKYDVCKRDLSLVLDSTFDIGILFALFNSYALPEIVKPVFFHSLISLTPLKLHTNLDQSNNLQAESGRDFMRYYFGSDYYYVKQDNSQMDATFGAFVKNSFPFDIQSMNNNDATTNFMYLPLKIAILGLPYSNHMFIANYLKDLFNLVNMDTKSLIRFIFDQQIEGTLTNGDKAEILQLLKDGQQLQNHTKLFMASLQENFNVYDNEVKYLNSMVLIEKQQNLLALKAADLDIGFDLLATQQLNANDGARVPVEDKENNAINEQVDEHDLKVTIKPNKRGLKVSKESNSSSIEHVDLSNSNIGDDNTISDNKEHNESLKNSINNDKTSRNHSGVVSKNAEVKSNHQNNSFAFIDKIQPSGVLFIDYPHTVDECLNLEKELSNYVPVDRHSNSDNERFNILFSDLYGDKLPKVKSDNFDSVFFDLIIEVTCKNDQIFERAMNDKKREHPEDIIPSLCNNIIEKRENMKKIAGFYKSCNTSVTNNDEKSTIISNPALNISEPTTSDLNYHQQHRRVFTIDSSKPEYETIPRIEALIRNVFISKIQHYKDIWANNEADNAIIEQQKREMASMIEEANVNIIVSEDEFKRRVSLVTNTYTINHIVNNLSPKIINILKSFLDEYDNSLNRFYQNINVCLSSYFSEQFKLINGCLSLFDIEDEFNSKIQDYVCEYNNFIYSYKRLLNTEDVKNELHGRVVDLVSVLKKEIVNASHKLDEYFKSFFDGVKHKRYIELLVSYFIGLLLSELQKLIAEHYMISYYEYIESNYTLKVTEIDDKKTKKIVSEVKPLPSIDIPLVCKTEVVINKFMGAIDTKGKDDTKAKAKKDAGNKDVENIDILDTIVEKIENAFASVIKSVESNQFDELTEKQSVSEQLKTNIKDKSKPIKTITPEETQSGQYVAIRNNINLAFISKADKIKSKLNSTIAFLKSNKQRIITETSTVTKNIASRFDKVGEELILHLAAIIKNNNYIRNYIYLKDGQLIEDVKLRYKITKHIEVPDIIEPETKNRFSCNDFYELYKVIISIKNAFGLCDKTRLLDFLVANCSDKFKGTVLFPTKWKTLKLENLEAICDRLESSTDLNNISYSYFIVAILFEEFKVPSTQLINFYSQYAEVSPYMTKDEFINVS